MADEAASRPKVRNGTTQSVGGSADEQNTRDESTRQPGVQTSTAWSPVAGPDAAWRPDQAWSFSIPSDLHRSDPADSSATENSWKSNQTFETATGAPWDAGWRDPATEFNGGQGQDHVEDVLYFSGRSFEKLDRIARAIARESKQPDFVIVGPYNYVDVLADQEPKSNGFFMTATELEASVGADHLDEYFNEF